MSQDTSQDTTRRSQPSPQATLPPYLDKLLVGLLAAFGFVLPLSTAAVSLGMAALLACSLLLVPAWWRTAPWREPVVTVGLILLAWIMLHTALVSGLNRQWLTTVNSYHELLLCALLLGLFRLVSRPQAFLGGLALGTGVYALAHWVSYFELSPRLNDYLEPRYISAGYIMAITAFVLLEQSYRGARHPRLLRLLAAFLAATVVFTIQGRTGQLLIALLAAYATWCCAPRAWRLGLSLGLTVLLLGLAFTVGSARERVPEMLGGVQMSEGWEHTSTGIRIGLLTSALETARHHGLTGIGFARFAQFQEQSVRDILSRDGDPRAPESLPWLRAANPHSEYLMQQISGGVVSLALFLAWLAAPLLRRHQGRAMPSLVALSLAFALGALFNSLLLDFVEAHFHVAMLAWLLAGLPATDTAPS